jgi:putative transcriptional regulator
VFHVKPSALPRRLAALGAAAFVLGGFAAPDIPRQPITPPPPSLAGRLLIAQPDIGDPRFAKTVLLMARHNPRGALGIVINRPIGRRPLAELVSDLGMDATGVTGAIELFAGGPVQPSAGFIIHSPEYRRPRTIAIGDNVAMTPDPTILLDIGHHKGPVKTLVAFGYAGWAAGQLEAEQARGGWLTCPGDPKLIFDEDRADVWKLALARATD